MIRAIRAAIVVAALIALVAIPGTAHAISAGPSSVDFGDVPLNTTVTETIVITLDSGYRFGGLNVNSLSTRFGGDPGTCAGFVGPGTCDIKASFGPTTNNAGLGTWTDKLVVRECPSGSADCFSDRTDLFLDIDVHGTGFNPLAITTTSLPAGTVGTAYPASAL